MRYTKKEETNTEKFNLPECVTLWKHTSKKGSTYLSGNDTNKNKVMGFISDSNNLSMPKIRIYEIKSDNAIGEEIITLWENESKSGNVYLSGYTNEKEKIVGFYGKDEDEKRPFIKTYFNIEEK